MIFKAVAIVLWILGLSLLLVFNSSAPEIKLSVASVVLLMFVKVAALLWQKSEGAKMPGLFGLLCFMFAWPGVRVDGFQKRTPVPMPGTGDRFLESWLTFLLGLGGLIFASWKGGGESLFWNYVGLYSFLLIIHLGILEVMVDGLRLVGFSPQSPLDRPWLANSLRDFWSFRWNRPFIDMNRIFFLKTFKNILPAPLVVFMIFLISGILHELALSYPVNAGWGLPLLYFAFQGVGYFLENRYPFRRLLVLAWVIVPSPLLFHAPFVMGLVGKLQSAIQSALLGITVRDVWFWGWLVGGFLHLLVLVASVQVPRELQWKKQFALLSTLNRKVVWTYGVYIFCIILFCSGVSFYMSLEPIGNPVVGVWALFISLFWWARVGVDTLYMKHADWPEGPLFKIGHVCLATVFIALSVLYTGLFVMTWK